MTKKNPTPSEEPDEAVVRAAVEEAAAQARAETPDVVPVEVDPPA